MSLSEQYWTKLLQEFGCDSDEQLASLGIPIEKNESYRAALSHGDEEEKKRYETTAAVALLHTHYRFVQRALKNDALGMYLYAKNYGENCAPEDALNQIHQKIIEYGGLYRYSHQTADAVGALLSAYQRLGLPSDSERVRRLKQLYADSMKDILQSIAYGLKETKEQKLPLQDEEAEKPLPRKKKDDGFSLEKYRSNAHFKARQKKTLARIAKYCGHLFGDEEYEKRFGTPRPPAKAPVPVQEIFLSAPQRYALTEDADGYGLSVSTRYEAMLREVCAAGVLPLEKIYETVQSAMEEAPANTVYQSIWQDCLSRKLEQMTETLCRTQLQELEKMQNACDLMHDALLRQHEQSIHQTLSGATVFARQLNDTVCGLQKIPDRRTEELLLRHCEKVKEECDRLREKADAIRGEYERKVEKRRRKEQMKKLLLWSGVALAVLALAAVILEVLL